MEFDSPSFRGSLKGHFLIAGSSLRDPNFENGVVFLVEHQAEGAFGLVINKPSGLNLAKVLSDPDFPDGDRMVYDGGPVRSDILFLLHELPEYQEEESEIMPGIYLGRSRELLNTLAGEGLPYRVFSGYAGWEPNQLEKEMKHNSWLTLQANPELVFSSSPEGLWRETLRRIGGLCEYYSKMVEDPLLN